MNCFHISHVYCFQDLILVTLFCYQNFLLISIEHNISLLYLVILNILHHVSS